MKIVLLSLDTKNEDWAERALSIYLKKIKQFCQIEIISLNSPGLPRNQKDKRLTVERDKIFSWLRPEDYLILLDEKGRAYDSKQFAQKFERLLLNSVKRVVFLVGGPYGVDDLVKKKAAATISLGPMTMNHLLAKIVLMEQIYRAFTIIRGIPYHNE
ncbi:MAG: 23S rRNA (pseudouridine(1915)-N(3))-methyltransferase RlmH [Bdellovibrionaceae bacterium]|nr:23S rRNA (pseudouridine(1915)-N(3))-methyltransferase RlmH [Pseudobdellovibrionaceae bacterium]